MDMIKPSKLTLFALHNSKCIYSHVSSCKATELSKEVCTEGVSFSKDEIVCKYLYTLTSVIRMFGKPEGNGL